MKTSEAGIRLIKRFTILHTRSHLDQNGWVVGYDCRQHDVAGGMKFGPDMEITQAQAEAMLQDRVAIAEALVTACSGNVDLEQNQFDALVSYVYGLVDMRTFINCDIAKALKAGNLDAAGVALNRERQKQPEKSVLELRRWAEVKMFLNEDE